MRMDAETGIPGEDFCLQEDCSGSRSSLRGSKTRKRGKKQKGDKLLKLGFKAETCKNL